MGQRLSIDKHVSNLHELLDRSPHYFERIRFESKISPDIKQHIKVSTSNKHHDNFHMPNTLTAFKLDMEIL